MSENPRFLLAGFWLLSALRCLVGVGDAHTTTVLVGNIIGTLLAPLLAYGEIRQGFADRKARKAATS